MTLYTVSILLFIIAALLGVTGIVFGLAFKGEIRQLHGVGMGLLAMVLGLVASGVYGTAQRRMHDQLAFVPATTFIFKEPGRSYRMTVSGVDAACLATHIQQGKALLRRPDGSKLKPSDVTGLETNTPENLPRNLNAAYCDYVPNTLVLAPISATD